MCCSNERVLVWAVQLSIKLACCAAFHVLLCPLLPLPLQVTPVDMGGNTILHVAVQRGKYDVIVRVSVRVCVRMCVRMHVCRRETADSKVLSRGIMPEEHTLN